MAYLHHYEKPDNFGCLMGGLSHFYINTGGNVLPCPFLPVSFGNIVKEEFLDVYTRMREAVPRPLHPACPSFYIAKKYFNENARSNPTPIPYEKIKRKDWKQMYDQI